MLKLGLQEDTAADPAPGTGDGKGWRAGKAGKALLRPAQSDVPPAPAAFKASGSESYRL